MFNMIFPRLCIILLIVGVGLMEFNLISVWLKMKVGQRSTVLKRKLPKVSVPFRLTEVVT